MKRIKRVPYYLIRNDIAYTTKELAILLKIHKATVLQWIKDGLPAMKDSPIWLLKGSEIKPFFLDRKKNKIKLKLEENYCPKCKKGVEISDTKFIEKSKLTEGNLQIIRQGKCKICGTNTSQISSSNKLRILNKYSV